MKRTEYTPADFAWTQWTIADIERVADEIIEHKKKVYTEIKNIATKDRNFENTIYAIEASNHPMWKFYAAGLLMNVSPSAEIRTTAQKTVEKIESALVDIEYDEGIYHAVKEYAEHNDCTVLDMESQKLVSDMLREYRRMGFALSLETRNVVKDNLKKLSAVSNEFSKNINDYEDHIVVTRAELDGLSEGYIANLKQDGEGYRVGLSYPELNPFLENATNAGKRKELSEKSLQKGGAKNIELLKEMVRLRDENAQLLGYTTHGAFRLEVRMAKNTQMAFSFMHDLMDSIQDALAYEAEELRELKHTIAPNEGEDVYFYDTAFLSSELKKQKFAVDEQRIREYFPMETVKKGMFEVYEKLFSVQFKKVSDYPVWHEDVEVYAVRETDGRIISYFLLDLYPREGKYGHAAAFNIITGHQDGYESENYTVPVASMVANFPKSHASNPSLMGHSEVETLFHEFGHIMHQVLTTARFCSQAGSATAQDFVEAPSQMLENWVWNKEVLKIISQHYLTGESLPETVLNNMLRAKNHMIAHWTMRQMVFALYDMQLHTRGIEGELNEEYASLVARYLGIELPKQQLFLAGFGHLYEYDAGYYGYMWSLVYAMDMFTRFEKEGVLNVETGREYRKWILEKGSSQDEMSLVEGFLGRPVSNEAFLKEMGL